MEEVPFGRYRLRELLGKGGMGRVYRAYDTATDRIVAVKVLPDELAGDATFQQRFRGEAHKAAALTDPHVVPIHSFGEIEGRLYVDMRLIEGRNLDAILREGRPLDAQRSVNIIDQVASALAAAHKVGLVHRDVKPSNILLTDRDFVYLIDFGIARGTSEQGMTQAGQMVGTWAYMAPERFETGKVDPRSDVYALACVLYECLTNRRPYPGDTLEQQMTGHLALPPPAPSQRPGVSPEFDSVISRGMAKDPAQRYQSTLELADGAKQALTMASMPRITTQMPRPPVPHPPGPVTPNPSTQRPPGPMTPRPHTGPQTGPGTPWPPHHHTGPATPPPTGPVTPPPTGPNTPPPTGPSTPWPPASRPGGPPPTGQTPGPQPWWRGKAAAIAAVVVLLLGVTITGVVVASGGDSDGPTTTAAPPPPPPSTSTAPVSADSLLLDVPAVNAAMGTTGMTVSKDFQHPPQDDGEVLPPDCYTVRWTDNAKSYGDTGYSDFRAQILQQPVDNWTDNVVQSVLKTSSSARAQDYLNRLKNAWAVCNNKVYTDVPANQKWQVEGYQENPTAISIISVGLDAVAGAKCEDARAIKKNFVIAVAACRRNGDPAGLATAIAEKILAEVQ